MVQEQERSRRVPVQPSTIDGLGEAVAANVPGVLQMPSDKAKPHMTEKELMDSDEKVRKRTHELRSKGLAVALIGGIATVSFFIARHSDILGGAANPLEFLAQSKEKVGAIGTAFKNKVKRDKEEDSSA